MASHSTLVTSTQVTTLRYCFLESFRLDHDLQRHCQWMRILCAVIPFRSRYSSDSDGHVLYINYFIL